MEKLEMSKIKAQASLEEMAKMRNENMEL